jgi:hypothetical protein
VAQVKAAVPGLMELDLRSNALDAVPAGLQELASLRVVRLNYNKLQTVPPEIYLLERLQVLELSGNLIESLPEEMEDLVRLRELDISGNKLTSIPDHILGLESLQTLVAENNAIESLPEDMHLLKSLMRFDVSTNKITRLPLSMGALPKLQSIDVSSNSLKTIPATLGRCKSIRQMDVRYNDLDETYKAKSEEGVFRFLEFLREEEERLKQEEIERMKPVGTEVGSWLEYKIKYQAEGDISDPYSSSEGCPIRVGHTWTAAGNVQYVFGGVCIGKSTKSNFTYVMNEDKMEWRQVETTGRAPSPRDGHCTVYDAVRNRLVVFGGRGVEKKRLNDVHYLDLEKLSWHMVSCEGPAPSPRENVSAVVDDAHMYIFGGQGSSSRYNEVFMLDLAFFTWSQTLQTGSIPSPRSAAATYLQGRELWVQGGKSNFVSNDTYVLNLDDMVWTKIHTTGKEPPATYGHVIHVSPDEEGGLLHVFGGHDELDGVNNKLFLLEYSHDLNTDGGEPAIRGEWIELDAELGKRVYSTHLFDGEGILKIMQVGSDDLGVATSENSAGAVWDVFKSAVVFDLKEAPEGDDEGLKDKKSALVHHNIDNTDPATVAPNFISNSEKEKAMLHYIGKFSRIFKELYPQRRPMLFVAKNEFDQPKCVCTTIRPSQLHYTELYDLPSCARFVAAYLEYQPLANPLQYPTHLVSPSGVLDWRIGDCFDFSILLTSLLRGYGYDAHCVAGYAPQAVTLNDQSAVKCPYLEELPSQGTSGGERKGGRAATKAGKQKEKKKSKYHVSLDQPLESTFVRDMAEQVKALHEAVVPVVESEDEVREVEAEPDVHEGKRVHCWVLVLAGKREVAENIFVEPSTGQMYPTTKSPYISVESMWNHENIWVNMQLPEPHSDSRGDLSTMSLDLKNRKEWEPLLDTSFDENKENEAGAKADGVLGALGKSRLDGVTSTPAGTPKGPADAPKGGGLARDAALNAEAEKGSDTSAVDSYPIADMPPSWVPKLTIPPDQFDTRCPKGHKLIHYRQCTHEVFAKFGECSRWDGMVERLILFDDPQCQAVKQCVEFFARRKDRLRKRLSLPKEETVVEYFDPGASFGLKETKTVKGEERVMHFYHTARLDGLVERKEVLGTKITETFQDRDDRLVYRSVSYAPKVETGDDPLESQPSDSRSAGMEADISEDVLPIRKATQKFGRNENVPAAMDVVKRTFFVSSSRIRVDFHYGEDSITASSRLYSRDGPPQITEVDPLQPPAQESTLLEEYQALVLAEKECVQSVRDMEREVKEIMGTRQREELHILLLVPYYDVVRNAKEESDEEKEQEQAVEHDYLSAFLPQSSRIMSDSEAKSVRERCLQALKDRLIERANTIQSRHDEETAALAKRQANFQRDRDQLSRAEEEEYERACEESMFRIHVLEQRLKRHEEQALQKYYDLDTKLRNEPRLAALLEM